VFALESKLSYNVPLFAHCNDRLKHITQVWENNRVVSVRDINPRLPLSRYADEKQNLYGTTSIVLSATHLAYIMGASRIVYLGFEGKNSLHFYTEDKSLKAFALRKIKQIMLTGKYKSDINYNLPQVGVNPFLNVHRAFEHMMNEDVPNSHFAPVEKLISRELNYFGKNDKSGNRADIEKYISFLKESSVVPLTLKREEMVAQAGCNIISDIMSLQ
jgi:hypothetical protein